MKMVVVVEREIVGSRRRSGMPSSVCASALLFTEFKFNTITRDNFRTFDTYTTKKLLLSAIVKAESEVYSIELVSCIHWVCAGIMLQKTPSPGVRRSREGDKKPK